MSDEMNKEIIIKNLKTDSENPGHSRFKSKEKKESFLVNLIDDSKSRKISFEELDRNRFYRLVIKFSETFSIRYHPSFTVEGVHSMIHKFGKRAEYFVSFYNAGEKSWLD